MKRFLFLPLCLGLACGSLSAQLSLPELKRLVRLRPAYPFDQSGDYRMIDAWTLRAERDSLPPKPAQWWQDALLGKIVELPRGWELGLDGLVNVPVTFGKVDGAQLGYEFFFAKNIGLGHRFVWRSQHSYATRTRAYQTQQRALYYYAPYSSGLAVLDFGRTSLNTLHIANDEEFAEAFLSPWATNRASEEGYLKTYLSLRNSINLTPRLRLDVAGLYEGRRGQSAELWGQREELWLHEWRLGYDLARPLAVDARYPSAYGLPRGLFSLELGMLYREGWRRELGLSSTAGYQPYRVVGLSMRSAYAFADHQRLDWSVVGEHILENRGMGALDALALPTASAVGRSLISNTWATAASQRLYSGSWLWAMANYGGGRLALAHIPLLKRLQLDEQLHLRAMYRSSGSAWLEGGYSIGLGRMLRVGAFVGTDLRGDNAFAFRLSLPMLYLTGRSSTRY